MNWAFGWFFSKFSVGDEEKAFFLKWFRYSLALILVTAVFSSGFYHFDEQWQILEFMGLKLGMTTAPQLPWEYHYQMRSWSQPFLYFLLTKALFLSNPFTMALVFRVFTGLVGWYGLCALAISAKYLYKDFRQVKLATVLLSLCWYAPYLRVRPSSESMGGSVLAIGLVLLIAELVSTKEGERRGSALFWAGLVCGLSFLFRYQLGLPIFGIWVWLLFFGRASFPKAFLFAIGVCAAVVLDLPLAYWGHGHLSFPPWNYFYQNLVLDKASNFPTMPWWYYFTATTMKGIPPMGLILVAVQTLFWALRPKSVFTWATLPLLLIHIAIPAKAVRYMFPIAIMTPLFVPWLHAWLLEKSQAYSRLASHSAGRVLARGALIINLVLLFAVALRPARPLIGIYRELYHRQEIGKLYYTGESPYHMVGLDLMFYRRPGLELLQVSDTDNLPAGDFWFLSQGEQDMKALKARGCSMELANYPLWALNHNYLNWTSRSRIWSLFRCST